MNRTAWTLFRDLKEMHGEVFIQWLYGKSVDKSKRLGYKVEGVFWLLSKTEQEAIEIMDQFIRSLR